MGFKCKWLLKYKFWWKSCAISKDLCKWTSYRNCVRIFLIDTDHLDFTILRLLFWNDYHEMFKFFRCKIDLTSHQKIKSGRNSIQFSFAKHEISFIVHTNRSDTGLVYPSWLVASQRGCPHLGKMQPEFGKKISHYPSSSLHSPHQLGIS